MLKLSIALALTFALSQAALAGPGSGWPPHKATPAMGTGGHTGGPHTIIISPMGPGSGWPPHK